MLQIRQSVWWCSHGVRGAASLVRHRFFSTSRQVVGEGDESHAQALVYFYDPNMDLFFPNAGQRMGGHSKPAATIADGGEHCRAALEAHNQRLLWEARTYAKHKLGVPGQIYRIQKQRENDMAETAYIEYLRDLESSVSRESTELSLAQRHLLQWWSPLRNAINLLQTCIVFRHSDLSAIAEDVQLADPEIVASFSALLKPRRLADDHLYAKDWAPVVSMIRADEAAAIVASSTLAHDLKCDLFRRHATEAEASAPAGRDPQHRWDSLAKAIGRHLIEQANLQLSQSHVLLHNTFQRAHNKIHELWRRVQACRMAYDSPQLAWSSPQLRRALLAKNSRYKHRVKSEQDVWGEKKHQSASVAMIHARKLLGDDTLHLSPLHTAYVGAAMLHLMVSQAVVQRHDTKNPGAAGPQAVESPPLDGPPTSPAFARPIQWTFQVTALGGAQHWQLEACNLLVDRLVDRNSVLNCITPIYGPCVMRPESWVSPKQGGYISARVSGHTFRVNVVRSKSPRQWELLNQVHSGQESLLTLEPSEAEAAAGGSSSGGGADPGLGRPGAGAATPPMQAGVQLPVRHSAQLSFAESSPAGARSMASRPLRAEAQAESNAEGRAASADAAHDARGGPNEWWARELGQPGSHAVRSWGDWADSGSNQDTRTVETSGEGAAHADAFHIDQHLDEAAYEEMLFDDDPLAGGHGAAGAAPGAPGQGDQPQESGLRRVFAALNVLGDQGWRVNTRVFDVVLAVWSQGGGLGDVPPRDNTVKPEQLSASFHLDLKRRTLCFQQPAAERLTARREEQREAMKLNRELLSLRGNFTIQCRVIGSHADFDELYFPHNLDFRGRAYPMSPHFNHMSNDMCRGVLQFHKPKPLGPHGFAWLLIHLANVVGTVDKKSFDVRRTWSLEHLPEIMDSADRPLSGRRWWLAAEKPWQALATCMEIAAALRSGDVAAFESSLPVHQDGSCNGLQHYAALGGDVEGAQAVNVLDASEPQDVYSRVAVKVREKVLQDAGRHLPEAVMLRDEVDRKLVKQTVMTSVYGVTQMGARDQVFSRLIERDWPNTNDTMRCASYASKLTLQALQDMFGNANKIMQWLALVAERVGRHGGTVANAENRGLGDVIKWTTPLNLPVVQPYRTDGTVIRTITQDIKTEADIDKRRVSTQKQKTAFPPNFVHSLDATHMMMTALGCGRAGLSFAGVHDSYWTHAANVDACRDILRHEFYMLYKRPGEGERRLLEKLLDEVLASNPYILNGKDSELLLSVPPQGDLDLEDVKKSTYFFN